MRATRKRDEGRPGGAGVAEEWDEGLRLSAGVTAVLQRVVRWAVWAAVCAGPLLGVVALMQTDSSATAQPVATSREPRAVDTAGPGGFAAMYVDAFLSTAAGDEEELAVYFPSASGGGVRLPEEPEKGVGKVAPVRVAEAGGRSWSVTVSARLEDGGARYFRVPVAERGGGLVGLALPAEVAAPVSGQEVELGYGEAVPPRKGDPAAGTLRGFFDAYLAGGGQLDRFLSPGTRVRAVSPAPYERVELERFAVADSDDADEGAESGVPADGERLRVLADVSAQSAGGARPMTYALELSARDGRWEVAGVEDAPVVASGEKR